MTTQIEAKNLNDVAAALCATKANWASTLTSEGNVLFRGADEALSMVYGRAQDMDQEAFEAYRNLTALFYALKAFTRGYERNNSAYSRFARRFA